MRFFVIRAMAGVMLIAAGAAGAHPDTAPSVATILGRTPEARGVFEEADKGAARHVQSGLVCPLVLGNTNLWHLYVDAADGSDVGCDYGRNGPDDTWIVKLTIFAVKAPAGITDDDAFAIYQREVKTAYPDAKVTGPAIVMQGEVPPDLEDLRSEEYQLQVDGHSATSDLVVTVRDGWIIEIRGTAVNDAGDHSTAVEAAAGKALPALAILQATSTVGKTQAGQ